MRLLQLLSFGFGIFASVFALAAIAVEIIVPPGMDTLSAAISSANDGDTLILQDGSYVASNNPVAINKSLNVRPENLSVEVVVSTPLVVDGSGISVTIQGLTFTSDLSLYQAASVSLLQNRFTGGSIKLANYQTSGGDGELRIIGNLLTIGSIVDASVENAYIAGNTLNDGYISVFNSSAWIVGNDVSRSGNDSTRSIKIASGTNIVRILGNRVACFAGCIDSDAQVSSIANNIVKSTRGSSSYSTPGWGIKGSNHSEITNNSLYRSDSYPQSYDRGIRCGTSGQTLGNIVIGYGAALDNCADRPMLALANNLCVNAICTQWGENNLSSDPQFLDFIDFRLSQSSPAIDAGPVAPELADLDRSRNDMGAYGGPWNIEQFDVQRDPANYAPYVYPIFNGGTAFSGGTLELKALGVAKLR